MKTYITNIFERIKKHSKKIEELTLLTDKHWVVFNDDLSNKITYIFQKSGVLLISVNGKVSKSKWEYLGNNSLLIDVNEESYLFKQGFVDDNVLALKIDGIKEYAILLDEHNISGLIKNIKSLEDFLYDFYLNDFMSNENLIHNQKVYISNKEESYRVVDGFNDGFAVIINDDLNYGFINENREVVQRCVFEFAENFACNLALVRENNKFGFVDKSFNYVIKPIYEEAKSFENNIAKVVINKKAVMINTKGEEES